MEFVTVAKTYQVPPGTTIVVDVEDDYDEYEILIAHVEGDDFYAIDDLCTHDNGPLGDCDLDGARIECPRHGAKFDVRNGAALTMPAIVAVQTYPVRVVGDEIQIALP
ncbi:MAG: non-heme iron oxygenase ferredoxin subunit [Ardenticatenaceae bacterium]